jgi:hypothetical protein
MESKLSEKYRSISVKTELANFIEQFISANRQYGYRSISQFMEDSARKRLEELKVLEVQLPRFEQLNHDMNGVKVLDRKSQRIADIYFKPEGIWCDLCETETCEHVDFALSQRDVQNIIRKRRKEGWKLPEV